MLKVPFSPPYLAPEVYDAVKEVLESGWITTGPKVVALEKKIESYTGAPKVFCLNSATAGLELMLRWWGIEEGDEVIVPAYTYCATANVVLHCGATPIMVDANYDDFTLDTKDLAAKITSKTKAIIPVDIGGLPCDYREIREILEAKKHLFSPKNEKQKMLGRCLLMADAAHSLGAMYIWRHAVMATDISVYSFHAVKNLTTAEGGAIAWNLPPEFDLDALYKWANIFSIHGQSKSAFAKFNSTSSNWEYDVIGEGYKCNLPDILAAIGLVGMQDYDDVLRKRGEIVDYYNKKLQAYPDFFELPIIEDIERKSCYHLYLLKLKNHTKVQRDAIIEAMYAKGVATNVHYKPLPMLSLYKNLGYEISDYPVSQQLFEREITLPVFFDMTAEQMEYVVDTLIEVVCKT